MTDESFEDVRNLICTLRKSLERRGFKIFTRSGRVQGRGYGVTVSVVDPVDPSDICFSTFLTVDELKIVNKGNSLFWRFLG